jgi:hypothetical protein
MPLQHLSPCIFRNREGKRREVLLVLFDDKKVMDSRLKPSKSPRRWQSFQLMLLSTLSVGTCQYVPSMPVTELRFSRKNCIFSSTRSSCIGDGRGVGLYTLRGGSSSSSSSSNTGTSDSEGFQQFDFNGPTSRRWSNDPNPPPSLEELEEFAKSNIHIVDLVLDEIVGDHIGIITDRYIPSRWWLWQQWSSTVFYHSLPKACSNMVVAFGLCIVLRRIVYGDWNVFSLPLMMSYNSNVEPISQAISSKIQVLGILHTIWMSMNLLTTLVLTFFAGQAYSYWSSFYLVCRNIQGRMNDMQMLLSSHASRKRLGAGYTTESERFLTDINNKLRAFHILMWASQARRFRILLTDRGMSRMVSKGVLSPQEKEALDLQIHIPKTQKHFILLEWVLFKCREARKRRILLGDDGLEYVLLEKACSLRSSCAQISNKVQGRMPLSYAHFVQVLVDIFLILAPIAQYGEIGIFAVLSVGLLTLFYSGFLDLAFVLLDPIDDEQYREGCVQLDLSVLLRESTASSHRWMNAGSKLKW